jgi:hypothetical protein
MGPSEHDLLARKARRAYELGRLRMALRVALIVVPAVALGIVLSSSSARAECACLGVVLLATAIGLRWYGRGYDRAVVPGVLAGVLPMSAGLVSPSLLAAGEEVACVVLCTVGLVSGVLLARYATRDAQTLDGRRWFVGVGMAAVMAVMGCLGHGFEALLGLVLGAVIVAAYFLARGKPRSLST